MGSSHRLAVEGVTGVLGSCKYVVIIVLFERVLLVVRKISLMIPSTLFDTGRSLGLLSGPRSLDRFVVLSPRAAAAGRLLMDRLFLLADALLAPIHTI